MNVVKCRNRHFFDADKYPLCPHCGAEAVPEGEELPEQPEKKAHSFFHKKKSKTKDVGIVSLSEKTMGKTFGVFSADESPRKSLPEQETESMFGGASGIQTDKNGAFLSDAAPARDPSAGVPGAGAPNIGGPGADVPSADVPGMGVPGAGMPSMGAPGAGGSPENETRHGDAQEPVPSASAAAQDRDGRGETLFEAIKSVSAGSGEKTVGFFSMGNHGAGEQRDPVVGWLVCVKGKHFGESFPIFAGRNAVGRSASNKIVLSQESAVSREKHAWITYEPKKREFFLQPGDSSGLSYLNGENVMESKKLKIYDQLEFGNGMFLLIPLCGENFTWEDFMDKE